MSEVYTVHYMDFVADMCGVFPSPLKEIRAGRYYYRLKVNKKDMGRLLKYISKKDQPDKFYETIVRLYIKFGDEEIFVTCDGRVKRGSEEYLLNPQYFLRLRDYLEMLKVRNGIKEGVPKYY